jgi:hypothetical protein
MRRADDRFDRHQVQDGALVDPTLGLTGDEQAALLEEIHTPFSHAGYTRDGALRAPIRDLPFHWTPRAAVNRCACCRKCCANIVDRAPAASDAAAARKAAAEQPPVTRLIVEVSRQRDHRGIGAQMKRSVRRPSRGFRRSRANRSRTSGRCQAAPMWCACSGRSPRSGALARTLPSDETVSTPNRIC